jgi:hypothetical protein
VQPPVEAVDAVEVRLDQLDGRHLSGADEHGQPGGAQKEIEAHGRGC